MENEKFDSFIDGLKDKGMDDKDIASTAFLMFGDKKITKDELTAILEAAGYGLPENVASLSEDELRARVLSDTVAKSLIKGEGDDVGEPKPYGDGEEADEEDKEEKEDEESDSDSEDDDDDESEDEDEGDKKRKAAFDLAFR